MISLFFKKYWMHVAVVAVFLLGAFYMQHKIDVLKTQVANLRGDLLSEQNARIELKANQDANKADFEKTTREQASQIYKEAVNENNVLKSSVARLDSAGRSLRAQLSDFVTASKQGRPAGTTDSSPAGTDPLDLFAELYGELDTAAASYAEEAVDARARGARCERFYDQVRAESLKSGSSPGLQALPQTPAETQPAP